MVGPSGPATLVISLDFELFWGVRDKRRLEEYQDHVLGGRAAVSRLLELFSEYGIHATWAVVGFLFFDGREALLEAMPRNKPQYTSRELSPYPYIETLGDDEERDPFHFAPSLIRRIQRTSYQEVGTHTFSHYYTLAPGADEGSFEADLEAAKMAAADNGVRLESIVFPRNQYSSRALAKCARLGFRAFRGNPDFWPYRVERGTADGRGARAARLLDAHVPLGSTHSYAVPSSEQGMCNVAASRFLRPCGNGSDFGDNLRLRRIRQEMNVAARRGHIYHMWWHPHNMGTNQERNLDFLRRILDHFISLQEKGWMVSRNMGEIAGGVSR